MIAPAKQKLHTPETQVVIGDEVPCHFHSGKRNVLCCPRILQYDRTVEATASKLIIGVRAL